MAGRASPSGTAGGASAIEPARSSASTDPPRNQERRPDEGAVHTSAGSSGRSVRADRPEAVRAVDRAVHARLEGNLRLVAAGRADHREVLAGRAVVATLVAAGATDVAGVIAAVALGAPAGAAARAALGVTDEPFLLVVLLVGRRVDEFHSAVHTGQGSIEKSHVAPPRRGLARCTRGAAESKVGGLSGRRRTAGTLS